MLNQQFSTLNSLRRARTWVDVYLVTDPLFQGKPPSVLRSQMGTPLQWIWKTPPVSGISVTPPARSIQATSVLRLLRILVFFFF